MTAISVAVGQSLSVGRAITAGGVGGFSPRQLFRNGEIGFIYDHSRLDSFFQDAARTTPAAVGDPVGCVLDRSPNGLHRTASGASRPILRKSGNLYYLESDGVDDFMLTGSAALAGQNKFSMCIGVRKLADVALSSIWQIPAAAATEISFPRSAALTGPCLAVGAVELRGANVAAPVTSVVTGLIDGVGATDADKMKLRRNGAATGTLSGAGAAPSFNTGSFYFFRRNGSAAPANVHEYGGVGINRPWTSDELANVERWVGARCGVFF